eukprot:Clim_evm23s142 gene=Clim_evmTU23s142
MKDFNDLPPELVAQVLDLVFTRERPARNGGGKIATTKTEHELVDWSDVNCNRGREELKAVMQMSNMCNAFRTAIQKSISVLRLEGIEKIETPLRWTARLQALRFLEIGGWGCNFRDELESGLAALADSPLVALYLHHISSPMVPILNSIKKITRLETLDLFCIEDVCPYMSFDREDLLQSHRNLYQLRIQQSQLGRPAIRFIGTVLRELSYFEWYENDPEVVDVWLDELRLQNIEHPDSPAKIRSLFFRDEMHWSLPRLRHLIESCPALEILACPQLPSNLETYFPYERYDVLADLPLLRHVLVSGSLRQIEGHGAIARSRCNCGWPFVLPVDEYECFLDQPDACRLFGPFPVAVEADGDTGDRSGTTTTTDSTAAAQQVISLG